MLYDGVQILEGSKIVNLTVDYGTAFPSTPNLGEMFYRSDENQLYIYQSGSWGTVSSPNAGGETVDTAAIVAEAKTYSDSADAIILTQATTQAASYTDAQIFAAGVSISSTAANDAAAYTDSALTSLNASNLTSGTVPTARLASGTASSSTYLRGDSTWAAERLDLGMSYIGKAPAGTVALFAANKAFSLPAGLTNSSARAITAATNTTTFTLFKRVGSNSANIGTIQFAAGSSTGTFTFAGAVSFAVGDMLIISLNAVDTTLADGAFTLTGTFV